MQALPYAQASFKSAAVCLDNTNPAIGQPDTQGLSKMGFHDKEQEMRTASGKKGLCFLYKNNHLTRHVHI